jgi:hypothetical protein
MTQPQLKDPKLYREEIYCKAFPVEKLIAIPQKMRRISLLFSAL